MHMKSVSNRIIFILILAFFPLMAISQKVNIEQSLEISQLTEKYIQANARVRKISGYRIQIFFQSGNNSRSAAETAMSKFRAKYPKTPAYMSFREPNFRVRVGNFRTKHEAYGFLKQIQAEYINAFVIKDDINIVREQSQNLMETDEEFDE